MIILEQNHTFLLVEFIRRRLFSTFVDLLLLQHYTTKNYHHMKLKNDIVVVVVGWFFQGSFAIHTTAVASTSLFVIQLLLFLELLLFPVVFGQPIIAATPNYHNNRVGQQQSSILEEPRELILTTPTGGTSNRRVVVDGVSSSPPPATMITKSKATNSSGDGIQNSSSSRRRSGNVQEFKITYLGYDGIQQGCETDIMIQLFDDLPIQHFKDPNCHYFDYDDRIPSSNDHPDNNDNDIIDDNIFVHNPNNNPPNRRQHGCFIGKDGPMTLTMHLQENDGGIIAASINDYENNILYSISGDINNPQELLLFVRGNPLENMMDEADIDELVSLSAAATATGGGGEGNNDRRRNLEYTNDEGNNNNSSNNEKDSEATAAPIQAPSQTPTMVLAVAAPAPPTTPTPSSYTKRQRQQNTKKKHIRGGTTTSSSSIRGSRRKLSGGIHNLDIMVVWTKMAECELSNMDPDSSNNDCRKVDNNTHKRMVANVNLAIDETNLAFVGSGIPASLRLVHAYRHSKYKESDDDNARSFNALTDITHGRNDLDDIHEIRDEYGADLVAFIINANDYCGVGWLNDPPIKEWMFSVSHWDCATGYYSFGHEIGHNFGCHHNRGSVSRCDEEDYPGYNYGYRDPEGDFRSILAYDCRKDDCDTNKDGCMRVPRFSNPDLPYGDDDKPIGSEFSNCARQFTEHLQTVSGFAASILDTDTEEPSSHPSVSSQPSDTPTSTPSSMPSSLPSSTPTDIPSSSPSKLHTDSPSISGNPSSKPMDVPSFTPSAIPSAAPQFPSSEPSGIPSSSDRPSRLPSTTPTLSSVPSASPSAAPQFPSSEPTSSPTASDRPSQLPSTAPTSSSVPSIKPTAAPSSSAFPSSPPSRFPSGQPTIFPSSAPSSKDCTGKIENVCGYVENQSSSGELILVPGAYSVCVYKTGNRDDTKNECLLESKLVGVDIDSPLNDKVSLASCGCCEGDEDKDFCNNDPTCIDDADYVCDEKDGLVKTKYCYFDTRKSQNKEKCDNPFKDLKGDVIRCGNCV